jgi:hypothetical protein
MEAQMPDPYIPDDDRIDVIGRLTDRLDQAGEQTLREKAELDVVEDAGGPKPDEILKPFKDDGEKEKEDKEVPKEIGDKDAKEVKDEGEKDEKDTKEEGDKDVKDEGEKDFKDDKDKEEKEEFKEEKDQPKEQGDKDSKDVKDEGEKDGEKDFPEKDPGIFEGPDGFADPPAPERAAPTRPVM